MTRSAVDLSPPVVRRFGEIFPGATRIAAPGGRPDRAGGGDEDVLFVAIILYSAAIVAVAHALARD
jgi:hypothetical protein